MKFSSECGGRHRLSGAWGADEQNLAARSETMFAELGLLTLLQQNSSKTSRKRVRKNHVH